MAGLRLFLRQQGSVEVFQQRHIFGNGVLKILEVNGVDTAVNDRLFHRLQALLTAHHQLTERKHKVRFQRQRIIFLAVIAVDVHRVDVLGAGRADMDDLPMQMLHQRSVLAFRIADDNIIVCDQKSVGDFTFCAERFTGAGSAENQTVGILQLFSIHHDQIV